MQPFTGHLVDLKQMIDEAATPEEKQAASDAVDTLRQAGYEEVPEHLNRAARRVLQGQPEAYVSLTSGGKLSKHAATRRKARRKMAKASRRKNR